MSDSDGKSKLGLKMSVAQLETMSTKRINIKHETYLHSILVGKFVHKVYHERFPLDILLLKNLLSQSMTLTVE